MKSRKKLNKLRWFITWEIDMFSDQASTPAEAAEMALKWIKEDGTGHIFEVLDRESGKKYSVDLDEIEEDQIIELKD